MEYFNLEEFSRSATAIKLGIDNTIPEHIVPAIKELVDNVLDPLRRAWGRPLVISSGYRCPELNRAVGGAPTSHHLRVMAADINPGNLVDNRRLFQMILDLKLPFTQLIDESGFSWVHISYEPGNIKHQVLKL